jgi:hypothetical protein
VNDLESQRPEDIAKEYLRNRIQESGRVIYSPSSTFRKGLVYFMGHNPGGKPNEQPKDTIFDDLEEQTTKTKNNYDAEAWGQRGESKLQKSVRLLFEHIDGITLQQTFTTNLIFFRSHTAAESEYKKNADYCWGLHKRFLGVVDPEVLIVFGSSGASPFSYIYNTYFDSVETPKTYPANHGNWKIRYLSAIIEGRRRVVFGFPHLSRYMVHPECEGVKELQKAISTLAPPTSSA